MCIKLPRRLTFYGLFFRFVVGNRRETKIQMARYGYVGQDWNGIAVPYSPAWHLFRRSTIPKAGRGGLPLRK
tara:strand:+ start:564 stop:779 length:216 start_codon:yes stop_codon:yes gene_type:complete